MWQKKTRKTLYTLNLGGDFNSEITELTYPTIKHWCKKCGYEFYEITERKFPEWVPTYEKHQVFQLAQEREDKWSIFVDSDTCIHNDTPDLTLFIPKDHCAHNGSDPAFLRWKYTKEMIRDGRNLGSCTWFCVASWQTLDLFRPMDELTQDDVTNSICPLQGETITGLVPPERLTEDFTFSQNIARFGLKFMKINDLFIKLGYSEPQFLAHWYAIPPEEKAVRIKQLLEQWRML